MSDKFEVRLFINNEFVDAKSGKTFDIFNPYDESLTAKVALGASEDIELAVQAASKAQKGWEETNATEKARLISKLADKLEENAADIALAESKTMGQPQDLAKGIVAMATASCRQCAGLTLLKHGTSSLNTKGTLGITLRQPFGVVAIIIPWNAAAVSFAVKAIPAIAAGNTVVLKSSEKAPLGVLIIARLMKEVGFPAGVLNIVSGFGPDTGAPLAMHMNVRKLSFTGSGATGKKIMQMAAQSNLKNVTLELGGKSPALVFEDADLKKAAMHCAGSLARNSGQICAAHTRVYVQDSVADEFEKEYIEAYKKLAVHGDPSVAGTVRCPTRPFGLLNCAQMQGPLADKIQFERVMTFIEKAKASGKATIKIGGGRAKDKGYFIQPTIFTDVDPTSDLNVQEVFGPVGVLHRFKTEEEAIKLANDTEYGLSAAVYTENVNRAIRVATAIEAGGVGVNQGSGSQLDLPFGGYKQSGIGREFAESALDAYLETKTVVFNLT